VSGLVLSTEGGSKVAHGERRKKAVKKFSRNVPGANGRRNEEGGKEPRGPDGGINGGQGGGGGSSLLQAKATDAEGGDAPSKEKWKCS